MIENSQQQTWIPSENVPEAEEKTIHELKTRGVLVQPIAADNHYITVSFINTRSLTSENLKHLLPLREQLVSLKLSYCNLSNLDLSVLEEFKNLTWLYFDNTNITDNSFQKIPSLPKLKYLNMVNTSITDSSLATVTSLKDLKQVYLYQTKVTEGGIKKILEELPSLKIDTGQYTLPKLASDTVIYKRGSI